MYARTHTRSLNCVPYIAPPSFSHPLESLLSSGHKSASHIVAHSLLARCHCSVPWGRPAIQHPGVTGSGCIRRWKLNLWDGIAVSLNVVEVKARGLCLSQLSMGSICRKHAHPCGVEIAPTLWEMLALLLVCISVWDPGPLAAAGQGLTSLACLPASLLLGHSLLL